MTNPLLRIQDLHIEFHTSHGRVRALNGVSFDVQPGEVFGLVGETGCGKTITGLSVLRLLPPPARITAGRITFEGLDVLSLPEREMQSLRGRKIAVIFQDPASSLNPVFTIGAQIEKVIRDHLHVSPAQAHHRARGILSSVGLPDVDRILDSYPHELSGGMQQRAMIALALSCQPSLLIADEPTTALDVTIQSQILSLLRDVQKEFNLALILITHNLGVVAEMCDRLAVLYAGRVVETGPTQMIFESPQHPYTHGLMSAIPRPGSRGSRLAAIPGSVPVDPGAMAGCVFALRCAHAFERCRAESPPLFAVSAGHQSACFLAEKDLRGLADPESLRNA
jgi:oligopeptide/dipeptide ABC transporter ATP-binding protein